MKSYDIAVIGGDGTGVSSWVRWFNQTPSRTATSRHAASAELARSSKRRRRRALRWASTVATIRSDKSDDGSG